MAELDAGWLQCIVYARWARHILSWHLNLRYPSFDIGCGLSGLSAFPVSHSLVIQLAAFSYGGQSGQADEIRS